MKTKLCIAVATLLMAVTVAAAEWKTDFDQTLKDAKEKNHAVLLLFSGTDWCPPCKALHENVLSSKEFKDFADSNLELVLAAFPRKTPISKEQQEKNNKLATRFGIEGFPTSILLDANGKMIEQLTGCPPPDAYMKFLKEGIQKKPMQVIKNGKVFKDVDLAQKTEMICYLAVDKKVNFSLDASAGKNTQWSLKQHTVGPICQVETKQDSDDKTAESRQNKLVVTLTGKAAGSGKMLFLCGNKYIVLSVIVRKKK